MDNLFKIQRFFKNLSLQAKLYGLVGVMIGLISLSGIFALQGVMRAYRVSKPLAESIYPMASSIVNALHSLEYSRALAIQYALEQDRKKLSFLKTQFDAELEHSHELLTSVQNIKQLSKDLKTHFLKVQNSQNKFEKISGVLMAAHQKRLNLSLERLDQIEEANLKVQKTVDLLNHLSDLHPKKEDLQFWNVAAQVILLEQRYLYQPALSTPLSLTPEQQKNEEGQISGHKNKFRNYMTEFLQTHEKMKQGIGPKHRAKWENIRTLYQEFSDRVQGENGVFLISQDEILQLGIVGFQLEQLEEAYKQGAKASFAIQTYVSEVMQEASASISNLRKKSYGRVFAISFLFAFLGLLLGLLTSRYILGPLRTFAKLAHEIGQGNLDQKIEVTSQDEVGELAQAFNQMAQNLRQKRKEIETLNFSLEKQVLDRTEALAKANVDLLRANEVKAEFLSNVTHDLKTPLNSILGFTQIVLSDPKGKLNAQQTKNLETVIRNGKELLQLINSVLEFTKSQAGKMEVVVEKFSFETLLNECMDAIEVQVKDKKIKLLKEIETHLPQLETDRPKVKRILLNLLSNAAKYTKEGEIEVSASKVNDCLEISVMDTGEGIPKQNLFLLFNPQSWPQGAKEGSGMGLMITKQLVNLLGGILDVQSEVDKGSVFRVRIPFVYEKANPAKILKEAA